MQLSLSLPNQPHREIEKEKEIEKRKRYFLKE